VSALPEGTALPEAFLDRLRRIVPEADLPAVLESFEAPQAVGLRVETLRAEPSAVADELRGLGLHPEPVEGLPSALWVPASEREAALASAAHADGRVYVQNLASQLPPVLLDPQPGERVLDLCAAPGSKTRQLAALMGDEGEIAAVEVVRARFFKLRANLEAQGATSVRTFHRDGTTVWRHRPEHFDRVLLDAPCSTEGRFRADDPETTRYWHPRKTREMARKQDRLLFSALHSLRPGGTLVYSTCTFAPEENEGAVSRVLERFGEAVEAVPVEVPEAFPSQEPLAEWGRQSFHPGVAHTRRILPGPLSEGFFVAKLVKHAPTLP
jgi:NOL1/NOP2/sun family putative RNA methylase